MEDTSLEEIKRSLQKDAGLPKVPDLTATVRTLSDVKAEIDAASARADELTSAANNLSIAVELLVEKLTANLGKLEDAEQKIIDLTLKKTES